MRVTLLLVLGCAVAACSQEAARQTDKMDEAANSAPAPAPTPSATAGADAYGAPYTERDGGGANTPSR